MEHVHTIGFQININKNSEIERAVCWSCDLIVPLKQSSHSEWQKWFWHRKRGSRQYIRTNLLSIESTLAAQREQFIFFIVLSDTMNNTLAPFMDETLRYIFEEVQHYIPEYVKAYEFEYTPWVFSLLGATLVGLSGILPLLVIPADTGAKDGGFSDREYSIVSTSPAICNVFGDNQKFRNQWEI